MIAKKSNTAIKKGLTISKKTKQIIKPALIKNMELGYPLRVLFGINAEKKQEQNIIESIRKHTIDAGIEQTIGNYDR